MRRTKLAVFGACLVGAGLLLPASALSGPPPPHDIPVDVLVRAFVHPDHDRLQVLMRVPLEAMRDVELPLRGPGYLEIPQAGPELKTAATVWLANEMAVYEDGRRLPAGEVSAVRVSLPSDRSFGAFRSALTHMDAPPLTESTNLYWRQAMMDVLLEYPITSDASDFSVRPALARLGLRVVTVLRFVPADGPERAYEYVGDPGIVRLDPHWYQAALRFVALGFDHILHGLDHLLFLLCLVIPVRRLRSLVSVVTAFTVAHSVTLAASAYGLAPSGLWFPPLVETLIAASIVFMALENIAGAKLERRWIYAFGFGLVHGFGFSFALRETLQFAGGHLLTSLLSFNLGVELGQLLVLSALIPALALLFRFVVEARVGSIILSALVAHTAWHWMTARGQILLQYDLPWATLSAGAGALALAALIAGGGWLALRRFASPQGDTDMPLPDRQALGLVLALAAAATASALAPANAAAQDNPYRAIDDWAHLPGGRSWGSTSAVFTTPTGDIWVAERCGANSCADSPDVDPIILFSPDGEALRSFGAGVLLWPHGMFVDADGNVWVTDARGGEGKGHQVHEFSPDGRLLRSLGKAGVAGDGPDTFNQPSDVLVAPDGSIFVADGHGADGNNRIVKLAADGSFITAWGRTGTADGEFRDPHALAMDSQGRLFVGDRANSRIQIFDQDGNHLATWTQFGRPSGIFIDHNDVMYVADSESNTARNPGVKRGIRVGSVRDGVVTAFIPDPEPDPDHSATSGAEGVAVSADGTVYGAEVGPRRLRKYVPRGN